MDLSVDYWFLSLIAIGTILIVLFALSRVKDLKIRVAIVLSAVSIFIYSGYGIALDYVDNKYLLKYLIALFFFYVPFVLIANKGAKKQGRRSMDAYFDRHHGALRSLAYIYLFLITVPLVFPRFRMFDVFISGITIDGIYDYLNAVAADPFSRLTTALSTFFSPFFFVYIAYVRLKNPKSLKPYILFMADFLIGIMDSCYVGRSEMVYTALLLFFLVFCFKDGKFKITRKQVLVLLCIMIVSVPFLWAYTFIRMGLTADTISFSDSMKLLLASEATYPQYYDHILSSQFLQQAQSPFAVILWLICLPIPSVLWPSKPTLSNDVFTFSITGLHRTDFGYSSLLPSFLGESFMYFGGSFYWVFTFLMGLVFASILKYLSKNQYMTFFMLLLAVRMTAVGRAGATAAIPSFVNGTLFILLMDWFVVRKSKV